MKVFDAELFREEGHKVVEILADYLKSIKSGTGYPVLPTREPDELADYFDLDRDNPPGDSFTGIIKEFINNSNHLHHPGYIGHQCTSPLPFMALSHLTAALLNNGSAVYEMGPANTAMERAVLRHIARRAGFDDNADGVLTHGGSAGNLTALLAARQAKCSYNIWEEGVRSNGIPGFIVSEQSHYSITRNLKIMGLGSSSALITPSTGDFRIDTSRLEDTLAKANKTGIRAVAVVANACSTATGTYDNLAEIASFCRKHKLWLHVDGAHGLGVLFSEKYRHLAEGIELADSIVIDFHKMFMIPGLNTAVLFREGNRSYETFAQNASYLFEKAHDQEWYNGAKRTLECTKSSLGFVAWSAFRQYGDSLFGEYVDSRYDIARLFAEEVKRSADFMLLTEPESNIVCFRLIAEGINDEEVNSLNKLARKDIIEDGLFYIVQAVIGDTVWLRITIINPETTIDHLLGLLTRIRQLAMPGTI